MSEHIQRAAKQVYQVLLNTVGSQFSMTDEEGTSVADAEQARYFVVESPQCVVHIDQTTNQIVIQRNDADMSLHQAQQIQRALDPVGVQTGLAVIITTPQSGYQHKDLREASAGHMWGRHKTSYQDIGDVRLVIKHAEPVDAQQPGSRSRRIRQIYVCQQGERTPFPVCDLTAARAMARHLSCGGEWSDSVGSYICDSAQACAQLRNFVSSHGRSSDAEVHQLTKLARNHLQQHKHTLRQLCGARSYQQACAALPELAGSEVDPAIRDLFAVTTVNPKAEPVLPALSELARRHQQRLLELSEQPLMVDLTHNTDSQDLLPCAQPVNDFGRQLKNFLCCVTSDNTLVEHLRDVAEQIQQGLSITEVDRILIKNVLRRLQEG